MNKILVMPVKNEDWILENTLKCASLFFDYIIIADQNSEDETKKICEKFEKVIYIKNKNPKYDENSRRQLLLDRARQISGENLIFALDADEVLSANIINNELFKETIAKLKPGMSLKMEWIQLWNNTTEYNTSHPWGGAIGFFAYYDDRKINFNGGRIHCSRVPEETMENYIFIKDIKVLHFQFIDYNRMISKQDYYRVFEFKELKNNILKINYKYYSTRENAQTRQINNIWFKKYEEKEIDLSNFKKENLFWQDIYVLRNIKKFGIKAFKWLDIWDIDWECKRQLINKPGDKYENIVPDFKISDPRNLIIRIYHLKIQKLISRKQINRFIRKNKLIYWLYKKIKK